MRKYIFISVVLVVLVNFSLVPLAMAYNPPAGAATPPAAAAGSGSAIQESFNVGEQLRIGGKPSDAGKFGQDNQGQAYFDEAKRLSEQTGQPVSPIAAFIVDVINFMTALIGTISLLVFITGGLILVTSEGQEDRLSKGKDAMIYSLIGLILTLAAYLIATFVQSVFF